MHLILVTTGNSVTANIIIVFNNSIQLLILF